MSLDHSYRIYKAIYGDLVGYLLGGTNHNYACHRICARNDSVGSRKERWRRDLSDLGRQMEEVGG